MDKKPDIGIDGGIVPANFEPEIELDNVSFRYPSRPDTLVLRNASLKVPRGSVVALVGPSGGGALAWGGSRTGRILYGLTSFNIQVSPPSSR